MGEPVLVFEKLKLEANPFVPSVSGTRMGRPLQTALGEVIRQIGLETPVIVVAGSAGTGKTLLTNMVTRACGDMGLSVRRVNRGDLVGTAGPERSDVLLVDEADSITDPMLQTLMPGGGNRLAMTTVLLCLPSSVRRFGSSVDAALIELTRLTLSDTRAYLLQRAISAGMPNLFEPAALELIVDASRGLPRSLWSIASLAYFSAAYDGSAQIARQHVAGALASQMTMHKIEPAVTPSAHVGHSRSAESEPELERPPLQLVRAGMASEGVMPRKSKVATGRAAGIAIAIAASLAVAVAIPKLLLNQKAPDATTLGTSPAVARNTPKQPAIVPVVQAPAPAPAAITGIDTPPKAAAPTENVITDKDVAARSAPAKAASGKTLTVTRAAEPTRPARQVISAPQPTVDSYAAVGEIVQAPPVPSRPAIDIDKQASAVVEAAQRAAAAQQEAAAQRIAAQEEADREKAAKDAAVLAQAAAERARIAKDAADRVSAAMQAAQLAAEEEASRQAANRDKQVFHNSLYGINH